MNTNHAACEHPRDGERATGARVTNAIDTGGTVTPIFSKRSTLLTAAAMVMGVMLMVSSTSPAAPAIYNLGTLGGTKSGGTATFSFAVVLPNGS
jgi:hypothetical protein